MKLKIIAISLTALLTTLALPVQAEIVILPYADAIVDFEVYMGAEGEERAGLVTVDCNHNHLYAEADAWGEVRKLRYSGTASSDSTQNSDEGWGWNAIWLQGGHVYSGEAYAQARNTAVECVHPEP